MLVVADTHVHLHPCHDIGHLLESGATSLEAAARRIRAGSDGPRSEGVRLLCLTEPAGRRRFQDLRDGELTPTDAGTTWMCRPTDDPEALQILLPGGRRVVLVAGRQVVTAERLELLALATLEPVPEGLPAAATVERIGELGAVPVLPWSPGKWTMSRRRTVDRLVESATPDRLVIGDSSLRPRIWPEPSPMRRARRAGLAVIAGSDPLPFPGEESRVGSYGTAWEVTFDPRRPATSLRRLLAAAQPGIEFGARSDLATVALRLLRHAVRRDDPEDPD